jgi:hypothetical protein
LVESKVSGEAMGASLTGLMVRFTDAIAESLDPSFTLKVKLSTPLALVEGV